MMDELFPILLFIVVVLVPLLERLRKRGQPPAPPSRQAPGDPRGGPASRELPSRVEGRGPAPWEPQDHGDRGDRAAGGVATTTEEEAEAVIPDDLWELLTGERRRPAPPVPSRVPEETGSWEEGLHAEEELERDYGKPDVSDEVYTPEGLSSYDDEATGALAELEAPARLAALSVAASEERRRSAPAPPMQVLGVKRARPLVLDLDSADALRRAVILREVLGPPKGLQ